MSGLPAGWSIDVKGTQVILRAFGSPDNEFYVSAEEALSAGIALVRSSERARIVGNVEGEAALQAQPGFIEELQRSAADQSDSVKLDDWEHLGEDNVRADIQAHRAAVLASVGRYPEAFAKVSRKGLLKRLIEGVFGFAVGSDDLAKYRRFVDEYLKSVVLRQVGAVGEDALSDDAASPVVRELLARAAASPTIRRVRAHRTVDLNRLSHCLGSLVSHPEMSHVAGAWSIFIPGVPVSAEGDTFQEAVDDMVDALRDYADDWADHLRHAPNHSDNWGLVLLVALCDADAARDTRSEEE